MATKYWVGGSGTWDNSSTGHWALNSDGTPTATAPVAGDVVIFDSASGTGSYTVTYTSTIVRTATTTINGPASGTLTFTLGAGFSSSSALTIGSLAQLVVFDTSTSNYGLSSAALTVGTGGTLTCRGSIINCTTASITGTVNANSSTFTGTGALAINSGGVLNAGSSTMSTGTSTSATTFGVNSGGTLNAGSATISSSGGFTANIAAIINAGTSSITVGAYFYGGGKTYYNVTLTPKKSAGYALNGSNTFNNLTITGNTLTPDTNQATSYGYILEGATTVTGTLTVTSGTNITYRTYLGIYIGNDPTTLQAVISCAAVSLINTDFFGVSITGPASPASGTNLGNIGDNSGITFTAGKTVYWNLAGTQSWTATAWATSSGGTPNINNYPLPQDTAVFDNAGGAGTVALTTSSYVKSLDCSSRTSAMSLNMPGNTRLVLGGNLLLGTTVSVTGLIAFNNSTSKTISGNNSNLNGFSIYVTSNTLTLLNNFLIGGFDSAYFSSTNLNGYTLTVGIDPQVSGEIIFNGGTFIVNNCNFVTSPNDATFTNGTGLGTLRFSGTTNAVFNCGNAIYNCLVDIALTGGAVLSITVNAGDSGVQFSNITNSISPTKIQFKSSNTYTFNNFNLRGTAGNLVTLTSDTPGSKYTLSKASGAVSSNYLSIQDSAATGGAVWYAGANSTNVSNNTGWIFKSFSSGAMALFLP
jgi:hypothetical protein